MGLNKTHTQNNYISTPLFIAMTLMAMTLTLSISMMTVLQVIIAVLWLWDGIFEKEFSIKEFVTQPIQNIKIYSSRLIKNKIALIFLSIGLIHILGLIHTSNFDGALRDFRDKLPILVFILVLGTCKAFSKNQIQALLHLYIAAILAATFWGFFKYISYDFSDIREISPFVNPIRFSVNICLGIFILLHFMYKKAYQNRLTLFVYIATVLWFTAYLFLLESITGIFILFTIGTIIFIKLTWEFKPILGVGAVLLVVFISVWSSIYFYGTVDSYLQKPVVNFSELEKKTELGNNYVHDTTNYFTENGKYIGLYLAEDELRNAWNKRSQLDFDGKDHLNQELKVTLYRFLSSKNLRKDAKGIAELSNQEIKAIENGVANYTYLSHPGLKTRIFKFLFGYQDYQRTNDPNGNSILQRVEYIKAALHIIKNNFWIGVGTGDTYVEYYKYYDYTQSKLSPENRYPAHNQYLSFWVSFGIIGLLWIMAAYLYPLKYKSVRKNYYYVIFTGIILLSMFTGDTMEMYDSITFLGFFNAFFLFGPNLHQKYSFRLK